MVITPAAWKINQYEPLLLSNFAANIHRKLAENGGRRKHVIRFLNKMKTDLTMTPWFLRVGK